MCYYKLGDNMHKKYYKFELIMTPINIIVLIFMVIMYPLLALIRPNMMNNLYDNYNFFIFFLCLIIYFIIHEFLHGVGYSIFAKDKKNIKYGAKLEGGVLYAMCQELLSKKATIISLALPTIILTFLALPLGFIIDSDILIILACINFIGAVGDIIMLRLLLKMPDVEYIDYDNAIGMYLVSINDLSKYKTFGIKFIESGEHDIKLINKSIPRIYISKSSKIIVFIVLLIVLISLGVKIF